MSECKLCLKLNEDSIVVVQIQKQNLIQFYVLCRALSGNLVELSLGSISLSAFPLLFEKDFKGFKYYESITFLFYALLSLFLWD